MTFATINDLDEILQFYIEVIDAVNKSTVKLGWNIDMYPNREFVETAILNGEMCINRSGDRIIACGVVNHNVNDEYDLIDWKIKSPKDKIATIHALATHPSYRGGEQSKRLLIDIENYCREAGDIAIHLDVIDTNIPAYKLYTRNGYNMIKQIEMYYEVVGTREFWMLEKLL